MAEKNEKAKSGLASGTTRTARKVKFGGTQQFVNTDTGELREFHVVEFEERDANFEKIWMGHILSVVEQLGNQKMKVLFHLIRQRHKATNQVTATMAQIAEDVGASERTVRDTIHALEAANIVSRPKGTRGVWVLNPDVVFRGSRNNRLDVLYTYKDSQAQQTLPGFEAPSAAPEPQTSSEVEVERDEPMRAAA